MKLRCHVKISNYNYPHSTQQKITQCAAVIAFSQQRAQNADYSDKDVFLHVLTNVDTQKFKYKVLKNVQHLFTKFVEDGKATIRFKKPSHDVIIKDASPCELKSLLQSISFIRVGQGEGHVAISPDLGKVEVPKTKLTISQRSEYPRKVGFSSSLIKLKAVGCSLQKFDQRVLKIKSLQVLDLSCNSIKDLPHALTDMSLKQLNLQHNELSSFPKLLQTSALGQSLVVLDLSYNRVSQLSSSICFLKKISTLNLDHNVLLNLPHNLEYLQSLKNLSAAHNNIKSLPFGVRNLHLNSLNMSTNPLNNDEKSVIPVNYLKSLVECSAVVVKNCVPYSASDLPIHLLDYLNDSCSCVCGTTVFQKAYFDTVMTPLSELSRTVIYDDSSRVSLKIYFCSRKCWQRTNRRILKF